jgi:hypothetical protein
MLEHYSHTESTQRQYALRQRAVALLKLSLYLRQDGLESALENSHRGGHLWIYSWRSRSQRGTAASTFATMSDGQKPVANGPANQRQNVICNPPENSNLKFRNSQPFGPPARRPVHSRFSHHYLGNHALPPSAWQGALLRLRRRHPGTPRLCAPSASRDGCYRWEEFLERHPQTSVFYTPGWLEALRRTYGEGSTCFRGMHVLFEVACLWEIVSENPISRVRQSRKRLNKPRVLMPEEFRALLEKLVEPYKTMVVIIACLGLRVSELLGLQWGDIDFENLTVTIQRSCSEGEICQTKSESSEGTLPWTPTWPRFF